MSFRFQQHHDAGEELRRLVRPVMGDAWFDRELGPRLYAERPKAFGRWLRACWDVWCEGAPGAASHAATRNRAV